MTMNGRRGLVLGAGGILGAAWTVGALSAIEDATGWDPRQAGLIVGTSAGAVLAALLRAGTSVQRLHDLHGYDRAVDDVPEVHARMVGPLHRWARHLDEEPCWPGWPRPGFGSLPLTLRAVCQPRTVGPSAACAAVLPRGRRSLAVLGGLIEESCPGGRWPAGTWIVAMNYHTGERETFGRAGRPRASLTSAVMASCAVPVWYEPVSIGDVPYVDGALCSPCSADLLVGTGLDELYVLAPMASFAPDRPRGPLARLERASRRAATKQTLRELSLVRAAGTRVRLLTPNASDLHIMGANMMDGARRGAVLRSARDTVLAILSSAEHPCEWADDAA